MIPYKKKRTKLILTPVKELPKKDYLAACQHDIVGTIETFMDMDCKIVKVEVDYKDFKNIDVAERTFDNAICKHGYPIKTVLRNGGLYLIKK